MDRRTTVYNKLPDRVEDEEELDEDATEGKDAAHDDTGNRLKKRRLNVDLKIRGIYCMSLVSYISVTFHLT
jgi:hypothetical protein